jgi:hypothetical protein
VGRRNLRRNGVIKDIFLKWTGLIALTVLILIIGIIACVSILTAITVFR